MTEKMNVPTCPWKPDDPPLKNAIYRKGVALSTPGRRQGNLGLKGRSENSSFPADRLAPKRVPYTPRTPLHQRARESGSTSLTGWRPWPYVQDTYTA